MQRSKGGCRLPRASLFWTHQVSCVLGLLAGSCSSLYVLARLNQQRFEVSGNCSCQLSAQLAPHKNPDPTAMMVQRNGTAGQLAAVLGSCTHQAQSATEHPLRSAELGSRVGLHTLCP
jgi:hypothetical protein